MWWWSGSSGQELARDDQPLNLARPLADRGQLHVAEVFLGRVVLDEAVAAVNLDAVVGDLDRDLAGIQLRHRRLERRLAAELLEIRGVVGQEPRRLDLGRRVGQLPLDRLEAGDRRAEGAAVARIVERRFVS